jgi:hypothetical protein
VPNASKLGPMIKTAAPLEFTLTVLSELYPAELAERWLLGMNPRLGARRPIDLLRAGRTQELLEAVADEWAGGFA